MVHKTAQTIEEAKVLRQPEEGQVTTQSLKAIHVHRIITQEPDDRRIQERQAQEHLDTVK